MKRIFVCSALRGDVEANLEKAREYSRYVATECEAVPIAPHLLFPQFLNDSDEAERNLGIECGLELLKACDELWYFGDKVTSGMVSEITTAKKLGIKVRYVPYTELQILKTGGMENVC